MDWATVAAIVVGVPLAFLVTAVTGALFFWISASFMAKRMGGLPKCPCASMAACGPSESGTQTSTRPVPPN
jgi:hypothetical protein